MKTPENILHEILGDNDITIHVNIRQLIYKGMTEYANQFKTERDSLKEQVDKLAEGVKIGIELGEELCGLADGYSEDLDKLKDILKQSKH